MLSHLTFLDLCKSVHFMWPISSFSKLCYWLCPHDNLMSSSVYHQPFSFIPPCYDFQSISTVSYLSALSPLFPVSSFPSTLSKQVWISFMLFSVLIMGVQGSIHVCVGCLPPSLSHAPHQILSLTHPWYQFPFRHLLRDNSNENCHQSNFLHYTTFLFCCGTSEKTEIWLGWSVMNQKTDPQTTCVCSTPGDITWMGACMPTPWMLIRTIVWKKTKCFSSLTETHACNPSCLITTFDSFLKPSPPPTSTSLCAESQLLLINKMTLLPPSFQPSLPLLQFFPSYTEACSQP